MRLIEIPDDGIIKEFIWRGNSVVGERRIDLSYMPTIEAEPVRYGRWEFEEDEVHPWLTKAICSNCEKVAEKSSHLQFRIGKKTFLHDHTYCPNCGAKMDGADT